MSEDTKVYKWNYDRLLIFVIAISNVCLGLFYVSKLLFDSYFIQNQISAIVDIESSFKIVISIIMLILLIYLNIRFIQKDIVAKKLISLFLIMSFLLTLKTIFTRILLLGFRIEYFIFQLIGIIVVSTLIYLIFFSLKIDQYFKTEEDSVNYEEIG